MIKIQLNGWQRLWVLLAVVYLVAVTLFTLSVIPKRSQILSSWAYDTVDLIKTHEKVDTYNWTLRKEIFGEASDEDIVERITRNAAKLNDKEWERKVRELEATYKTRLDGLLKEQMEMVGVAFLAWLIPLGLIYALGCGIGWVYRGFKSR